MGFFDFLPDAAGAFATGGLSLLGGKVGAGMFGFGQAPGAPDYMGAAEKTGMGNRPNQSTPWANSSWTHDANGNWNQSVGLNGGLGQANNSMMNQAASAWANPLDNGQQARQHAEDAIYGRETSRLDPQWQQREHDFSTGLANQGIDPNSEAYSKAMSNFGRDRNDAYSSAQRDAIMGGGQEGQRQQQMDLTSRMAPMQGLFGMQGLSHMPNVAPGPNYLGAAGMQGNYGLDATNINNQGQADFWKGLTGFGGAAAGAAA